MRAFLLALAFLAIVFSIDTLRTLANVNATGPYLAGAFIAIVAAFSGAYLLMRLGEK